MHRSIRRSSNRHTKIFSAAAKTAYRHFNHAGSCLARWITTDHSGFTQSMIDMPTLGFLETIRYTIIHFIFAVISALVSGVLMFLLIYYGFPLLIDAATM